MASKQKQHSVVDLTGYGSKVRCYKEQYCIGTWNVRSMKSRQIGSDQAGDGKSECRPSRNQKMDLMGEFNSDDQHIYYCEQESIRRNGVAMIVNKRL